MLTQFINDHVRQIIDSEARDNSKFRVSDAGKCRLMRYWKRQGKPYTPDISLETLKAMQLGINIHGWIQQFLSDLPAGVKGVVVEQELEDAHRIGHFDLYLELSEPDEHGLSVFLYDIKTKSSKQWYYFDKAGRQSDRAHEYQVLSYDLLSPMPIDECRIAYLNRDTLEIQENTVPFELEVDVELDWGLLIDAWQEQEEPAPNPANWECKYCIYKAECPHSKGYYIV